MGDALVTPVREDASASESIGLSRRLKALAHPDRIALLRLAQQPERFPDNLVDTRAVGVCVNDLAVEAELPQSTASRHIGILHAAGLVNITQHGQWRYVRPSVEGLNGLAQNVSALARPG